ncbi:short-chain dehydrogenase/reductase [Planctomycetota bacterium]|nr:short-chain dehydrogenase/reductase [Planctomycetota bacterium]
MPRTILITGTGTGFGHRAASFLARRGDTVFATMREPDGRNKASADRLRSAATAEGLPLHVVELDVTSETSVDRAVSAILAKSGGRIDVVINNAGYGVIGQQEAVTPAQATTMFDTNVIGILRVNRAVLPAMRAQRSGLIINLSSGLGRLVIPFLGVYGATKFAVESLTESLSIELKPFGIDCVAIEPGAYPGTDFNAHIQPAADTARVATYGEHADAPQKLIAAFISSLTTVPDPDEIVHLAAAIIDQPAGTRKVRYPKGNVAELTAGLNAESERIQAILAGH